jgi:predicted metal-dependent hydrolase
MQLSLNLELRTQNSELRTLNPEPGTLNPVPVPVLVFVRHPRARRYLIRVTDAGTVRVTLPRWGSKREAAAFAEREQAWIAKQLRARAERERLERERLERERRTTNGAGHQGDERGVSAGERRQLLARAKKELPPRLLELAARHGVAVTRISIRNQRWRWGSCSRSGHICLNWRLVTMPDEVRDYVLIHELMHLKRMDHSPKFWKLVAAACPGYQDARRWLRNSELRIRNLEFVIPNPNSKFQTPNS